MSAALMMMPRLSHMPLLAPPSLPPQLPAVAIAAANPPGRVTLEQLLLNGARLCGLMPPQKLGNLRQQQGLTLLRDMAALVDRHAAANHADIAHDGEYQQTIVGMGKLRWLAADFPTPLAAELATQLAERYMSAGKLGMACLADEWAEELSTKDWSLEVTPAVLAAPAMFRHRHHARPEQRRPEQRL